VPGEDKRLRASKTRPSFTSPGRADTPTFELYYNGKTLTVRDKDANQAASTPAPASDDALVDDLRSKLGVEALWADLILTTVFDAPFRFRPEADGRLSGSKRATPSTSLGHWRWADFASRLLLARLQEISRLEITSKRIDSGSPPAYFIPG
jgi:hypothetical protein